jgi:YD repeat-containing protein
LSLDGQVFVTYGYDDASRLVSITRGTQVFGFGYDAAGRRTNLTYPNGVVTSYVYDVASRVLDIHAQKGAQTVARSQYTYDITGNRLTKAHPEYAETYGYDKLYRLTGVDRTGAATPPTRWGYGYDAVGNRLWEQRDEAVTGYVYDERNRLLSTAVGGRMLWRGTLSEAGGVSFTSAQVNGQPARMLAGNVFEAEIPVVSGSNTVTLEARDLAGNATVKQ